PARACALRDNVQSLAPASVFWGRPAARRAPSATCRLRSYDTRGADHFPPASRLGVEFASSFPPCQRSRTLHDPLVNREAPAMPYALERILVSHASPSTRMGGRGVIATWVKRNTTRKSSDIAIRATA